MTHEAARALVERHFSGESLSSLEVQAMFSHVRGCAACRAAYDALADGERAALGPGAVAERMAALAPDWRPATSVSPDAPRIRERRGLAVAFGAFAVAAGAVLWFGLARRPEAVDPVTDVRIRGGAPASAAAWISLYRDVAGRGEPLGDTLKAGDALLVAYSATRDNDRAFLAVAAKDAEGRIHWLQPAYTEAGQRPQSLAIEAGVADRTLPEAAVVRPARGPLEVCALFTARPLDIAAVDSALEQGAAWPAEALRDCHRVEVRE